MIELGNLYDKSQLNNKNIVKDIYEELIDIIVKF